VPADWKPGDKTPRRFLLAARDVARNFPNSRSSTVSSRAKPEFTPGNGFVVQLYGRFCNASKFAGETDLFEAWENVRGQFAIDPLRVSVLGFSMGGASVWHLATHHAGLWWRRRQAPDSRRRQPTAKVFAEGKEPPPWWEQVLWRMYDATDHAANLANTSLIAYSGEIDPQKQSADIMEAAMARDGLKLERLVGPSTAHKYEPETKKKLAARIDGLVAKGREPFPRHVHLTTYTLIYPRWSGCNPRMEKNGRGRISMHRFRTTER
jgi:pimeloyl-ACP methyl ester carboxylesterase